MIVTFYSYKGGVGRSMALMNVGEILADVGYDVIVCDFDLEAPGLERYVIDDLAVVNRLRASRGVIDLLEEYRETLAGAGPGQPEAKAISVPEDFSDINGLLVRRPSSCAIAISTPNTGRLGQIRFLGAGRRDGNWANRYSERVQQFDWSDFYRRWAGAAYVDFFREDLTKGEKTIVLVDSRTGVTEYAGICTHHLADLVVLLSAPNDLNIDGTKWMADSIATADLNGLRGSRPLQVMAVAARVEISSQAEELAAFRERFEREFAASVPSAAGNAREFIKKTEIPYIPYFAFTEKVVARQNVLPHRELYDAYDALAQAVVNLGLDAGMLAPPERQDWLAPLATTERMAAALARERQTLGRVAPPLARVSPYQGLTAFEESDAAVFFGRETAVTELLERMSRLVDGPGLLMVSGVSGAGKSSLLRAGVLPRLRGVGLASAPEAASWPCVVFTPTRAPLDELALRVALVAGVDAAAVRAGLAADPAGFALVARQAALAQVRPPAGSDGPSAGQQRPRLLLVVDQLEQLFTVCPDEQERRAFIEALAAAAAHEAGEAPAALVVLVVRADFEARCADYPQLAHAVQDRYLLTSMTERQLRLAITQPAKVAGSSVDEDLADVLLGEVANDHRPTAGSAVYDARVLPLLSYALDQAWRSRTGDTLTLADYERTGGIEGAVADSAQGAYDRLTPAQQTAARRVFLRLTAASSDGVDTAIRASRAELTQGTAAEAGDVEAVLETFAAARLLILAADSVEISHEVLLTAWPLLRDTWLADSHADRIVRTRLRDSAAEWERSSRDPSYLYRGSLLSAAREAAFRWSADSARYPPLSPTERGFLQASDRAHRRSVRSHRVLTAILIVLVIGLASLAALHI